MGTAETTVAFLDSYLFPGSERRQAAGVQTLAVKRVLLDQVTQPTAAVLDPELSHQTCLFYGINHKSH